jgi:hypothetical protein
MIKNFAEVKAQLAELSEILNRFKSEQVQLRIVELIFKNVASGSESEPAVSPENRDGQSKRGRRKKPASKSTVPGKEKKRIGGKGPKPTLEQLIQEGYFKQPRTIGAIVKQCKDHLVRVFKTSDLSGPLGRLVADKQLTRSKNAEGQFEYKQ